MPKIGTAVGLDVGDVWEICGVVEMSIPALSRPSQISQGARSVLAGAAFLIGAIVGTFLSPIIHRQPQLDVPQATKPPAPNTHQAGSLLLRRLRLAEPRRLGLQPRRRFEPRQHGLDGRQDSTPSHRRLDQASYPPNGTRG